MSVVLFDLMGCARQDVEAEVVGEKAVAEVVKHIEVPGKDEDKEEQEAEPEGSAETSCVPAFECGEQHSGEDQDHAGGAFGPHDDRQASPTDIPSAEQPVR